MGGHTDRRNIQVGGMIAANDVGAFPVDRHFIFYSEPYSRYGAAEVNDQPPELVYVFISRFLSR